MNYVLNQYQGLGDILFCEPIARNLYDDGKNEIIWPILDEYIWIKNYLPYINFIKKSEYNINYENFFFTDLDEYTKYIPLRFANPIVRKLKPHDYSDQYHTMLDKYRLLGLSEELWKNLKWNRNLEKENKLYEQLVKKDKYVLVNNNWSDGTVNIIFDVLGRDVIYMKKIENYTLLDWSKIFENADEIHTVSTSNLFLLETLSLKTNNVFIYPRKPRENNFDGILEFVNKSFRLIL